MFDDRADAGRRLAEALRPRLAPGDMALGVPRGGVVVAAEVACVCGCELDVVVVHKIGAPGNPEYAVGAVDDAGIVLGGSEVDSAYLERAVVETRAEIERRVVAYRGTRPAPVVSGRVCAVVDDGIATGHTLLAAVESLRRRGARRIIVAAPVAAPATVTRLESVADEVVVLEAPDDFAAVGQFYRRFDQTTDREVVALLEEAWAGLET